jgi:hypothetical protein
LCVFRITRFCCAYLDTAARTAAFLAFDVGRSAAASIRRRFSQNMVVVVRQRRLEKAMANCKDAPKVVPYHDGMTLCPGQSTTMNIEIRIPQPGKGKSTTMNIEIQIPQPGKGI